jgi:membrane protein required for colicin V production
MEYELNNIDIAIIIITFISSLVAFSRGFVKEILSILGWTFGSIITIYSIPFLRPLSQAYIKSQIAADITTSIIIFITFMVFWIIYSAKLNQKIRSSSLSGLDRGLGFAFGLTKSVLLFTLAFILVNWIIPKDKQIDALKDSKLLPIAEKFADPVEALIPVNIANQVKEKGNVKKIEKTQKEIKRKGTSALFEKLSQPKLKEDLSDTKNDIKENFEGYNNNERNDLDRLIGNI